MHIYTLIPAPGAGPSIKHKATVVFSRNIRSARWASGEKERVGVVCRSSGGRGQGGAAGGGGGVYIWDEEGWEDEGAAGGDGDRDGAQGGVMEGVGIPNGMLSLVLKPTYELRSGARNADEELTW